ncbi:CBS domain-containing protein [Amycolatopsis sp. cg5]|uniref:CBS domain-containing protein n=1 Tax=Amycolatopsis sp. cg5 TaxID=3238802 RepID=UPI00352508F0
MGDDTNLAKFLEQAAKQAHSSPISLTVRELLSYWGAKRRGIWVVERIRRDLEDHELTIDPDFTSAWIDSTITLIPQTGHTRSPDLDAETEIVEETDRALPDVEMRVGQARSANAGVVSVSRDDSLEKARTLMMRHDFSQLPVMSGRRELLGAVTWESIVDALLRSSEATVRDAMRSAEVVPVDDNLLGRVQLIMEKGFVFVRAKDRTIQGIVTTTDLSQQFADLATPYFILGEIEQRLRRKIDDKFDGVELASIKDENDPDREVKSAADLTLGECARLLEVPANWEKIGWAVTRTIFIELLHKVRDVRNEVMHFSPDPLDPTQLTDLKDLVRWLRKLEPVV